MKGGARRFALALAAGWGLTIAAIGAGPAIWSSAGVALPGGCEESTDIVSIPSPDRRASIEVRCGGLDPNQRVG
jgi:hypothetical protein